MMEGSDPAAILREIQSLAGANHVPVRLVSQRQIQQVQGSEAPQGVIAFAEPLTEADLSDLVGLRPDELVVVGRDAQADEELPSPDTAPVDDGPGNAVSVDVALEEEPSGLEAEDTEPEVLTEPSRQVRTRPRNRAGEMAFLVVVDGVTDPQNLGALLRSAECAGVTGVVLPRHRSAHVTPTVTKVAAGAIEHVSVAVVPGVPGALQELERLGVWTVGLDERAALNRCSTSNSETGRSLS